MTSSKVSKAKKAPKKAKKATDVKTAKADNAATGEETLPSGASAGAPTDIELMMRVQATKDTNAYAEIVNRYKRKLFATCFRMLGQAQEAEDAVQDSLIKLWRYADKWDGNKAGVSTWLYTITTNTCRDALRKRKIVVEHDDGYAEHLPDAQPNGRDIMEQQQQAKLVKDAIDQLPDRQKQALVLSYYEGLSHKEIGDVMDATAKSIEGLVSRARNELKQRLAFMQEAL